METVAFIILGVTTLCVLLLWVVSQARERALEDTGSAPQFAEYETLRDAWVLDGDTIDDRATRVRYRFANIDAPETGDNAKCFRERELGERAKRVAVYFVKRAASVTVRNTFEIDRYGRRIAFIYVDGADLGEKLVSFGLASPWVGRRQRWCGRAGQLSELAAVRGERFDCRTCRNW